MMHLEVISFKGKAEVPRAHRCNDVALRAPTMCQAMLDKIYFNPDGNLWSRRYYCLHFTKGKLRS